MTIGQGFLESRALRELRPISGSRVARLLRAPVFSVLCEALLITSPSVGFKSLVTKGLVN